MTIIDMKSQTVLDHDCISTVQDIIKRRKLANTLIKLKILAHIRRLYDLVQISY